MCDGVEIGVWMDGRPGCLVAYIRTEPSIEKGLQMYQRQANVHSEYRTQLIGRPGWQVQTTRVRMQYQCI